MFQLLLLVAAVNNGPAYLSCSLSNERASKANYDLALNESSATAGITFSNGFSLQHIRATFSPTSVSFMVPGPLRRTISVSRTTLEVSDISIEGSYTLSMSGKCVIAPQVDRQF